MVGSMSHADAQGEAWRQGVEEHIGRLRRLRRLMKALPAAPRCKLCAAPFGGFGAKVVKPFGYAPSRKNPNLCISCIEDGPKGGFEADGGILFADVRGFTGLSEKLRPSEVADLANRFYEVATSSLIRHDAIVDKFVGDQVMAIFWPLIVDGDPCEVMVEAAEDLLRGVGYGSAEGPWLEVGVGVDYGTAYIGNVGTATMQDFTALGDVVNTASRLQSAAAGGEVVLSEYVYRHVRERVPAASAVELEVKGKAKRVVAHVLRPYADVQPALP